MNKYEYLYIVQGYYQRWEDLTAAETRTEAKEYLKDYRNNERGVFRIIQRRIVRES